MPSIDSIILLAIEVLACVIPLLVIASILLHATEKETELVHPGWRERTADGVDKAMVVAAVLVIILGAIWNAIQIALFKIR